MTAQLHTDHAAMYGRFANLEARLTKSEEERALLEVNNRGTELATPRSWYRPQFAG